MRDWRSYIGLPHRFGADPAAGEGADCLVMVMGILDDLGQVHPPLDQRWLDLAQRGAWGELEALWRRGTALAEGPPTDGVVTLLRNGPAGLGVAVVIDGGLLMVHHRRGVTWVPLHLLKPLPFFRFLP